MTFPTLKNGNSAAMSDASDWKVTTIPAMADLEVLKRCFICKDFLQAPVIAPCNHTFCSHCIREYLLSHNCCPLCKTELFESNLKRDVLLEEIVTCYQRLRPYLLAQLTARPDPIEINSQDESFDDANPPAKRHKLTPQPAAPPQPSETNDHATTTAIPGRKDLVTCPICQVSMSAQVLQSLHIDKCLAGETRPQASDALLLPPTPPPHMSLRRGPSQGIAAFFKPHSSSQPPHPTKPALRLRSPSPAVLLSTTPPPATNPGEMAYFSNTPHLRSECKLPKLDFASLTTPKLKEKLAAVKIPTLGTRTQLELRYNHYYVLYNSNLDSSNPEPEKALRAKLSQWERAHTAFAPLTATLFNPGTRDTISKRLISDKNFLMKEWTDAYHNEFRALVRSARQSTHKKIEKDFASEECHELILESPQLVAPE